MTKPTEPVVPDIVPPVVPPETPDESVMRLYSDDEVAAKLQERDAEWATKLAARDSEFSTLRTKADQRLIASELTLAATAGDAFNPAQLIELLGSRAKVAGDSVIVSLGEFHLSPNEAIAFMRSQPEKYGNLFRAKSLPGLGSHSNPGGVRGAKTDLKNMGPAEYRAARKEGRI